MSKDDSSSRKSHEDRPSSGKIGIAGAVARFFIDSRLTPIFVIVALLVGGLAVMRTPREEDPQIRVPMMDLFIPYPGASPREVEKSVT